MFLSTGRSAIFPAWVRRLPAWALCLIGCLLSSGCSDSATTSPRANDAASPGAVSAMRSPAESPATPETGPQASELLEKMRSVYREAHSYADNASVVFYAVVRASGGEQETPYTRTSVAFERPNKLSLTYQKTVSSQEEEEYRVVSNGAVVRSAAKELSDQIHEAISPLEFSAENFIPEPTLRGAVLQNSIENTLPQLALLFAQDQEQAIFPGEEKSRLLAEAQLDGEPFHRLELESPGGKRVLWVDQNTYTLRRMEIPIEDQRQQINARNQYAKVAVWIDFENVTIDAEIKAGTFELAVPVEAQRVRRFIPPPPAGPPELLGKPIGQYAFETLEGEAVTPATLAGKVTVLDFWSTNCPPCQAQAPVLQQVYEQFKDSDEVAFYAVSTDSRVVPNDVVAKTMASWGGGMPIVRDLQSSAYHELDVRQTPTLLLADREGRLQVFQAGAHQNPEPLIAAIQRLVDGEDLVAIDRDKHARFVEQYEQALRAATIHDSIIEVEIARPKIAPRKLPEEMQLQELWQLSGEQLQHPGDVLVLAEEGAAASGVLVLDGGEAIVEIDLAGQVIGRHELPAHDERSGGFLRSWSNDQGQRWTLVSGVGWQKVFVWDENWELVLSFPDQRHSGIGDVLLADLVGAGTPLMYVGYWGGLGLQGGTLDGRRLWQNRRLDHVLQIGVGLPATTGKQTVDGGKRTTWCTSTRGTLMRLGADGKSLEERYITGQSLMYFASQPNGEQTCGLSVGKVGQYTAVGFDASNSPAWEYPLPPGEYVEPLPRVQYVQLPGEGLPGEGRSEGEAGSDQEGWLIVAANGSLHWLSGQGELVDRFDYGDILTGVRMSSVGDQTQLLVSTSKNLTAWQVRRPLPVPIEEPPAAAESRSSKSESTLDAPAEITGAITAEAATEAAAEDNSEAAAEANSEANSEPAAKASETAEPAADETESAEPAQSTEPDATESTST